MLNSVDQRRIKIRLCCPEAECAYENNALTVL